jgi:hypothetical protein
MIFLFLFYEVVSVLWLRLRVWQINSSCPKSFFGFFIKRIFFLQFHLLTLSWLEIRLNKFFQFAFFEVISRWLMSFLLVFLKLIFFLISSFNIRLVEIWTLYLILFFSFDGVIHSHDPCCMFSGINRLNQFFFLYFLK